MRIIVYTGKGGVGKTSIAAATGARLASQGLRTIVMSTDAAHSLADAFNQSLGNQPTPIKENLWGLEIDYLLETERNWGAVQAWFGGVLDWSNLDDITKEEMITFPGMEELFSLLQIVDLAKSERFDVIIVDCAPTGETLRMLSYPNVFTWWLDKIFPHQRRLLKLARPVAKLVTGGLELPNDQVMSKIEKLMRKVIEVQDLLINSDITSIRLVLNLEKMVIAEARRSFTYLNLYGFHTDAVIINRVLPDEAMQGYWSSWKERQSEYEKEIESSFQPIPIFRVPLLQDEVTGIKMLSTLANQAFGEQNPGEILYHGQIEVIKKENEELILFLTLPFVTKDEVNLLQRGDELSVQVGAYRRKMFLPQLLIGRPVLGARFIDGQLQIRFGERQKIGAEEEEK